MKDTNTKTMKTKTRETVVAEPEMVYGRGHAGQWCLMPYFVPKKDLSFFKDMAKVRGWRPAEDDSFREQTVSYEPNACTVRAMKDALAGRVHHAKDAEDLLKQVGIGRKAKAKTVAPAKKLSRLEESIQQVERGEVFEASSAEEMCEQILGKGWREKDKVKAKAAAPAKKQRKNGLDRALEDVKAGRIHRYDSVEDMFKALGL